MTRIVINIYDYLSRHRRAGWLLFAGVTAFLIVSMLSIGYKEDIRDFLPFDDDNATAMEIYQDITGANRVYAVVSGDDTDCVIDAVEALLENIGERDTLGYIARTVATVDEDAMQRVLEAVYGLMPVLLTDEDYDRIDSLLASPGIADERVAAVKQSLLMPASGVIADNAARDPLGLFGGVTGRLGQAAAALDFNTGSGYIMSADGTDVFVLFESSFGPNESGLNGMLVDMLEDAADAVRASHDGVEITFTGAPVVAVENARCIKHDSLWSVIAAGLVIMALLIYVFRDARNIALIFVSVGWGWLFAMGAIALYYDSVSIIVIGIASVMLGIAVNYPLHLVDHLGECRDRKTALGQIVAPLVVGNVTTVGAFLCLVPLDSPALHDLGLFSSMLLIGTILFVLIFLPHVVRTRRRQGDAHGFIDRLASIEPSGNKHVLWWILALTVVFAIFSTRTTFDPDLRKINYLTDRNRELLDRLGSMFGSAGGQPVYVASTGSTWDEAVQQFERTRRLIGPEADGYGLSPMLGSFVVSRDTQLRRLERWELIAARRDSLMRLVDDARRRHGFSDGAFDDFDAMLLRNYSTVGLEEMSPLVETLFMGSVGRSGGRYSIVDVVKVPDDADRPAVIERLRAVVPAETLVFDVETMNGSLTSALADNFNYIGLACGCIVFLFLWLSMGRIELAVVSFLPMAVGWVWILGIMGMFGLHFNIVNVILATFIFGQGDDYTIFITEGLCYEHATGRRVLPQYKRSIIVSALIMFVGIGMLVFASHPAMRSLGQVAVIGMIVVVAMAYVIPPLAFGFLVNCRGRRRYRPVTARKLWLNALWHAGRLLRVGGGAIPGVEVAIAGRLPERRERVVVVYNHRSELDKWILRQLDRYYDVVDIQEDASLARGGRVLNVCIVGADMLLPLGEDIYSPGRVTLVLDRSPLDCEAVAREYVSADDTRRVEADRALYKRYDSA